MTRAKQDLDPSGLDSIDVDTAEARDATHFRRIVAAVQDGAPQQDIDDAVRSAREAGDPWAMIAVALGTSTEKAQERYPDV